LDINETQVGVSAQGLQKFLSEAVIKNPATNLLAVAYGNAALVACVKLSQRVLDLEAKLKDKQ